MTFSRITVTFFAFAMLAASTVHAAPEDAAESDFGPPPAPRLFDGLAFQYAPTQHRSSSPLFDDRSVLDITITAPLAQARKAGENIESHESFSEEADDDAKVNVSGTLAYVDPLQHVAVSLPIQLRVRGNTSMEDEECPFRKFKFQIKETLDEKKDVSKARVKGTIFQDALKLKIGTHCGELPVGGPKTPLGRLSNELSPPREAFIYDLASLLDVPSYLSRRVRIKWVDSKSKATVTREAFLLEPYSAARKRLSDMDAKAEDAQKIGHGAENMTLADVLKVHLFKSVVAGDADFVLKPFANAEPLEGSFFDINWNILQFTQKNGQNVPLVEDFDLANAVAGGFAPGTNDFFLSAELGVIREMAALPDLEPFGGSKAFQETAAAIRAKLPAALEALKTYPMDETGRGEIRERLEKVLKLLGAI